MRTDKRFSDQNTVESNGSPSPNPLANCHPTDEFSEAPRATIVAQPGVKPRILRHLPILLVLVLVATVSVLAVMYHETTTAVITVPLTYRNPTSPISFQYPSSWQLTPSKDSTPDNQNLVITANGAHGDDFLLISRSPNPANTSLDAWIRNGIGDTQHLLVLSPCPFRTDALECLKVGDQQAWEAAGHNPYQAPYLFRVPGSVYGIIWGGSGVIPDFQQTIESQILPTLHFSTSAP